MVAAAAAVVAAAEVVVVVVVEVVISLKGAIQDVYNLLTAQRTVSNMYAQVVRVQSCANHMQHVKHL